MNAFFVIMSISCSEPRMTYQQFYAAAQFMPNVPYETVGNRAERQLGAMVSYIDYVFAYKEKCK